MSLFNTSSFSKIICVSSPKIWWWRHPLSFTGLQCGGHFFLLLLLQTHPVACVHLYGTESMGEEVNLEIQQKLIKVKLKAVRRSPAAKSSAEEEKYAANHSSRCIISCWMKQSQTSRLARQRYKLWVMWNAYNLIFSLMYHGLYFLFQNATDKSFTIKENLVNQEEHFSNKKTLKKCIMHNKWTVSVVSSKSHYVQSLFTSGGPWDPPVYITNDNE